MSHDGQTKYSTNKLVWYKKIFDLDLTSTQKLLLAVLATFADRHGGSVYPSIATLADRSSLTARTVRRNLKVLRGRNLIMPIGQTAANVVMYRINIDAVMGGDTMSGGGDTMSGGGDTVSGGGDTVSPNQAITRPSPRANEHKDKEREREKADLEADKLLHARLSYIRQSGRNPLHL